MVLKRELFKTIPLHGQAKLQSKCLWVGGSCWGKGMELELANKTWAPKKTSFASFPNCLLESAWIASTFSYALSPRHYEAKWDTNGVVGGASAKLPHCIGHALIYPMENEMPFVHHVVEQWGFNYTNKNNKGLSERTWWHLMLKPKSKLM